MKFLDRDADVSDLHRVTLTTAGRVTTTPSDGRCERSVRILYVNLVLSYVSVYVHVCVCVYVCVRVCVCMCGSKEEKHQTAAAL